ncbi:BTAD domain-containing putative transcriptional regulator [Micromonospora sp. WMMD718]|uniref:BTAD domain-containing putative transcriptional regulator n=1 Tax=unclassified Micromonospora TaxID=2617518 RepID=UPI00064C06E1|nr:MULTISPECIES: BTAD domain-containing putative transcriptional regulator [unclassified Micromonospora]MDG4752593.1 BTAD domain-containing putative transcriptional regulator [Micromonospora sp. WMMD718]
MTTIGVLGSIRAGRDGTAIDLGPPRQRAVLARLVAADGQVVSVDRLVDDLWSADPPPRAQAALQVYVSNLRRVLEPGRPPRVPARLLVTAAPGYALRLPADAVDAWRFEATLRRSAITGDADPADMLAAVDAALACWSGPAAYAEFAGEPWADRESDRLAGMRSTAFERRAEALLALNRPDRVILDLDTHVREHPLREAAACLLATALYRVDRQADALAVLRATRAALAEQLGVDPTPALRALEVDLLQHHPRLRVAPSRPAPVAAPARTVRLPAAAVRPDRSLGPGRADEPLGRDGELARLRGAADRARAAGATLCWLHGDPGVGKSTLVRHLVDELTAAGWAAAAGTCPDVAGAPPGWAWHEIVERLDAQVPLGAAEQRGLRLLLGRDGPAGPGSDVPDGSDVPAGPGTPDAAGDGPGGRHAEFHLRRSLADYLRRTATDRPLLVVVEDVHRADGETLRILRHITTTIGSTAVLVVVTYRPTEVTDELRAARAALAGAPAVELSLGGLPDRAVVDLLHRHGVPGADAEVLHAVRERSGGNPLFVVELAKLIAAEGRESALDGVPAGLSHVLHRRLARLPAAAQTVLRQAAVLGPESEVDVLVAVDGGVEDTVLDGLEAGITAGLLVEPAPGRVRFAHALMHDALYGAVPLLRRTRMHSRVLAVLREQRPDDVAALGRHALAALTPASAPEAVRHAAGAARHAAALGAPREAATLWAGALRAADLAPDDVAADVRLGLLCGLAGQSALAGDVLAARDARDRAIRLAADGGEPDALHTALTCFDAPVTWTIRPDRIVDEPLVRRLEQALRRVGPDRAGLRSRLLATLAFEIEGTDLGRADTITREAVALARSAGDPELLCRALNARYFVAIAPPFRAELAEIGAELLAVGEAAGLTAYQCEAHHILYQAALLRADLTEARHHVDQAVAQAASGQLGLILAVMGWFEGLTALFAGDLDAAMHRYTEVSERMGRIGGPNAAAMGLMGQFTVLTTAGRGHELIEPLRRVHRRVPEDTHDVLAHALLSAGDVAGAREVWRPGQPIRPDYLWLYWMTLRGQVAAGLADQEVARRCYAELLPWAGHFAGLECGSISLGPVDQTLAALAVVLADPAAAAAHRAAGLRLARAVGAMPWADESAYAGVG